jgi:hypothetical protein
MPFLTNIQIEVSEKSATNHQNRKIVKVAVCMAGWE